MTMRSILEAFASDGRSAFRVTDQIFAGIITALRRDLRFAEIPLREFELIFASVRADVEHQRVHELRDRVHLDDVDVADGAES
jgi:hypothetical protein